MMNKYNEIIYKACFDKDHSIYDRGFDWEWFNNYLIKDKPAVFCATPDEAKDFVECRGVMTDCNIKIWNDYYWQPHDYYFKGMVFYQYGFDPQPTSISHTTNPAVAWKPYYDKRIK